MAFGIVLAALLGGPDSGRGQVVDANVLDATTTSWGPRPGMLRAQGCGASTAGTNLLDTGAPYYDTYACAEGGGWRWARSRSGSS